MDKTLGALLLAALITRGGLDLLWWAAIPGVRSLGAVVSALLIAVFVMVVLTPPLPEPTRTALAPTAPAAEVEPADEGLAAQARALGLDLLADFDDEDNVELLEGDAPVLASSGWYAMADLAAASEAWEDDLLPTGGSLFDELDVLDAEQLDHLFLQL